MSISTDLAELLPNVDISTDITLDAVRKIQEEMAGRNLDWSMAGLAYRRPMPIRYFLPKLKQSADDRRYGRVELTGVPTGLRPLDIKFMGGWQPDTYCGIMGLPKAGKTRVLAFFAAAAAMAGYKTLFVAIEMSAQKMYALWAGMMSGINPQHIHLGGVYEEDTGEKLRSLTDDEYRAWDAALVQISGWPIRIVEGQVTALDISRAVENIKTGVDLLLIDYLQKIQGSGTGYESTTATSNTLAQWVLKNRIPTLVGIQANRTAHEKPDKRVEPHMAHGASAIEKDVTDMIGIWRRGLLVDVAERPAIDDVELDILLARYGASGRVRTKMEMSTGWLTLAPKEEGASY